MSHKQHSGPEHIIEKRVNGYPSIIHTQGREKTHIPMNPGKLERITDDEKRRRHSNAEILHCPGCFPEHHDRDEFEKGEYENYGYTVDVYFPAGQKQRGLGIWIDTTDYEEIEVEAPIPE